MLSCPKSTFWKMLSTFEGYLLGTFFPNKHRTSANDASEWILWDGWTALLPVYSINATTLLDGKADSRSYFIIPTQNYTSFCSGLSLSIALKDHSYHCSAISSGQRYPFLPMDESALRVYKSWLPRQEERYSRDPIQNEVCFLHSHIYFSILPREIYGMSCCSWFVF